MIDKDAICDIIATYQKHGWILRRILLSGELKKSLGAQLNELFVGVSIVESKIDAVWFSRPPKKGGVAWEIRYLGETPFALLEKMDEDHPTFENSLKNVESLLCETVAAREAA